MLIVVTVFLLSALLILYPIIGNKLAEVNKSLVLTDYSQSVESMDNSEVEEMLEKARAYNSTLSPVSVSMNGKFAADNLKEAAKDYPDLLNINAGGVMGYIDIPSLDVFLPIYHGTDGETLERGVGHLLGTSLPVGGKGTHAVLTGHSGLARDKLLSDIEFMEVGDKFYIHILTETLAYEVDGIHTVLPEDTSLLSVESGEDLCTIITCTPYGVNTHRLLVRGHRVEYIPEEEEKLAVENETFKAQKSVWKEQYLRGIRYGGLTFAGITAVFMLALLARGIKKLLTPKPRKRGKHEKVKS